MKRRTVIWEGGPDLRFNCRGAPVGLLVRVVIEEDRRVLVEVSEPEHGRGLWLNAKDVAGLEPTSCALALECAVRELYSFLPPPLTAAADAIDQGCPRDEDEELH